MGLFSTLFSAIGKIFGISGGMNASEAIMEITELIEKFNTLDSRYAEDIPYADMADESYRNLLFHNFTNVPAVDYYNPGIGDFVSQLNIGQEEIQVNISKLEAELVQAEMANSMEDQTYTFVRAPYDASLETLAVDLSNTATEIETYLNEPTSKLEEAEHWMDKFQRAYITHIPPHDRSTIDGVWSEVMAAYRNFSSFAGGAMMGYGSQNLINAVYERVMDGEPAMYAVQRILDLEAMSAGGALNGETIVVPNAGFFGGGFFL